MLQDPLYLNFLAVLVFVVFGLLMVYGTLVFGMLVRPKRYEKDKMRIYECGEPTIGSSWVRYNMRFYTIALVYLVFDVEVVLLFPAAAAMRFFIDQGLGWLALGEITAFIVILALGLVYAWRYGNLDWVRSVAGPVGSGEGHISLAWMEAHEAAERDVQSPTQPHGDAGNG
jgi:NADH-quinone oxidoreductase subunit A